MGPLIFDEEIRIPLLFVGSGVSAGRIETTVETVDLLPTILEVLAVPLPPGDPLHGRSLVSLLDGDEGGEPSDRVVFASSVAEPNRYLDRGYELDTRREIYAARAGDWKLIVYPNVSDDYVELYDLGEDPMERRNVAAQQPEVRDRLLAALERIAAGVAASLARRSEIEPLIFDSQVTVRIEVADSGQADQVMFVPGMKRVGARLVEYVAPDAVAAYRMSRLVRLLAR